MAAQPLLVVSSFNVEVLARLMARAPAFENFQPTMAPFGQVYQTLSRTPVEGTAGAVVWTMPESVLPAYARALDFEPIDSLDCLAEVDAFAAHIEAFARNLRFVFVATWTLPPGHRGYGMLDWRSEIGLSQMLARINLRLSERLAGASNVFILDASRWLQADAHPAAQRMWYATKVPYRNVVFERAARDIGAAVQALQGRSRKLIVLDLDNTLWGNVVGETGWQGIRLGGNDHLGEAFRDFQRSLRAMTRKGVQLAVISKNDEAVALQAIDLHPEMLLRRRDLAGWRISWNDKAEALRSLVLELNLGLSAVVFIDDNPAERERIRMAYPEVLVPEWPTDPCAYVSALHDLDCFDSAGISNEDRERTAMYVADRERRVVRDEAASVPDWLERLQTRLQWRAVDESNIVRVAQLYNKTNQLNLSTRRMTASEILAWSRQEGQTVLAVSVADRFGDLGLTGVVGVQAAAGSGRLVDFILSCRAMGRGVEEAMLHLAASELRRLGASSMQVTYLHTERNRPTLDMLAVSKLVATSEGQYTYDLSVDYPAPSEIAMEAHPE